MEIVRERIMANLKSRLEEIKTDGGYSFDFTPQTVQRWSMHGNKLVDLPAIVISPGNEDEQAMTNPQEECILTVYLDIFYVSDPQDALSTDTYLNRLQGDVKKAILNEPTCGGEAIDTDVSGTTPFQTEDGQPYAGIIMELKIRYRHLRTDPAVKI